MTKSEEVERIPECTGSPATCGMCRLIGQIYEGFPKEDDPGCEVAAQESER